jgi:hypothetical protein
MKYTQRKTKGTEGVPGTTSSDKVETLSMAGYSLGPSLLATDERTQQMNVTAF